MLKKWGSGVRIWLFFSIEINIVSYRREDCLTPQFTDTNCEEEAPAEQDWLLVSTLKELWHQKYSRLWLKLKAEQTKTYFTFQLCPNVGWANRDDRVSSEPLLKLRHLWHKCCKPGWGRSREWTVVVLSFLWSCWRFFTFQRICLSVCSTFSCMSL